MFNSVEYNTIELNTSNHDDKVFFVSVSNTITNVDILSKRIVKKFVFDTVSNVDSIAKSVTTRIVNIIDAIDIFNKNIIKKFVNDSINNTDNLQKRFISNISDTITSNEFFAKLIGKFPTDKISLIEKLVTDFLCSFRKPKTQIKRLYNHSRINRAVKSVTKIIR